MKSAACNSSRHQPRAAYGRVSEWPSLLGAIASPALGLTLSVDDEMSVRSWHCADGQPCFQFQLRDRAAGPADASNAVTGQSLSVDGGLTMP